MSREPWETFQETNTPITFIIPWRSGNPTREISFKNMLNCLSVQQTPASTEKITCEVIIIEHVEKGNETYSKDKTESLVPLKIRNKEYPFSNYRYIQLVTDNPAFNKSWCMNVGAKNAAYNHLVFIDADSLMGNDFIKTIKYDIKRIPHPLNKMLILWNYLVKLHGRDEPIVRFVRPDITRALGGIWYSEKSFYWDNFGGMNENYAGYGGEDNDGFERAINALHRLGVDVSYLSFVAYPLVHQYHDNEQQSSTVPLWLKTRKNPGEVTLRLKRANLGNISSPTLIKMDDLDGN